MSEPLKIAIAGLGTVGAGLITLLNANADAITARCGRELRITAVSARDRTKDRGIVSVDLNGMMMQPSLRLKPMQTSSWK